MPLVLAWDPSPGIHTLCRTAPARTASARALFPASGAPSSNLLLLTLAFGSEKGLCRRHLLTPPQRKLARAQDPYRPLLDFPNVLKTLDTWGAVMRAARRWRASPTDEQREGTPGRPVARSSPVPPPPQPHSRHPGGGCLSLPSQVCGCSGPAAGAPQEPPMHGPGSTKQGHARGQVTATPAHLPKGEETRSPETRVTESPSHRVTESPSHRVTEPDVMKQSLESAPLAPPQLQA